MKDLIAGLFVCLALNFAVVYFIVPVPTTGGILFQVAVGAVGFVLGVVISDFCRSMWYDRQFKKALKRRSQESKGNYRSTIL